MTSSEKLTMLLNYFGTNPGRLGKAIGKPQTFYDIKKGQIKSFSPEVVMELKKIYPEINPNFFLYDNTLDEMIIRNDSRKLRETPNEVNETQQPYNTNVTPIPYEDYMEVEFVDLSVQAGPLGRAHLADLPKNRKMLVPREYDNGEYLVLKVDGNSMYKKDSDISIPAGTEILVKKYYLENGDQLPIRNNLFVIDAKDGQALKQIILHDVEKGFIRCHSYNEDYKDYDVRMEDILQIFIYRKVVSSRPPIPDIN